MDRNFFVGLGLMILILITFNIITQPSQEELNNAKMEQIKKDSIVQANIKTETQAKELASLDSSQRVQPILDSISQDSINQLAMSFEELTLQKEFGIFASSAKGTNDYFTLENDKLLVKIAKKGGRIAEVKMKEYQAYSDYVTDKGTVEPMALFDEDSSDMFLTFYTNNGLQISTKELYFDKVSQSGEKLILRAKSNESDKYIDFTYSIADGAYDVEYDMNIVGLQDNLDGVLSFNWDMKALSTEKMARNEREISAIFFRYNGGKRDYMSEQSSSELKLEAQTNWVAFKHNYFSSVIISEEGFEKGSYLKNIQLDGSSKYTEFYSADLDISRPITANTQIPIKFYFGPNDYDILHAYNNEMEDIVNLGWGIFGWTNKYLIIPIFNFLKQFNWGMGIIILLLTLIVRIIILPLTYRNYKSSAKMKVLRPEIEELGKKYPDTKDAMKKQQETMAMYRQTGVNPMAGCVPMLVQMPILIAVFRFFPSSLDLRQKAFLWAEDLSTYDAVAQWSANIPIVSSIYGNHISLFAILMAVTTILYTRMNSSQMPAQQPGMPNMQVMMYIFPVMMLFFFNRYSSGLTFYYFCGNLITMGIMFAIKTYMIDEKKIRAQIELNKKTPKKQSKFQARMQEMMKQQQAKQIKK